MTKEEFEKEYKRAEYRYAQLKQYKKLFDNAEDIEYKLRCISDMESILHVDVYKNFNAYVQFFNLAYTTQEKIKEAIKQDLEDRFNVVNQKIEEISLDE